MPNFHLLPEWAPQSAILITWPHHASDWAENLSDIEPCYLEITRTIAEYQQVLILCYDKTLMAHVQRQLKPHPNILYTIIQTNDTWIRDYGPITVKNSDQFTCLDFQFNAWGGKFPAEKDNAVNAELAQHHLFSSYPFEAQSLCFEGGAMETNGHTLITTTTCALDPIRNHGITETSFKQHISQIIDCEDIILLEKGQLMGDDTDGHIDTIVRFCDANTLCAVTCDDRSHPNYLALKGLSAELDELEFERIALPQPDVIVGKSGKMLPATYANFLITNEEVLVPTYQTRTDDEALNTLKQCFPHRLIKGIDCRALIEQNGSLHCATMQLPCRSK
jgi:agmatine/peptidylarginine deiminase